MMRFANKVAVVTGSGQGLGEAIARGFAAEGASVVVADLDPERGKHVAAEIERAGGNALACDVDVTNAQSVAEMVATIGSAFGQIDILVNGAGGSAREQASHFLESQEEVWDSVIDRNLKSAMICSRAVIGAMINRGSGRIINIGAGSALAGEPGLADYSGAKAGVIGFTKALAREVAPHGVTVNCVTPGIIETRAISLVPSDVRESLLRRIPSGRMGQPVEFAYEVLHLASEGSSYITGQNHVVCGGAYIGGL